jgi:hypothetical protein
VISVKDLTSFKWATVMSVGPIAIQIDGDSTPLSMVPDTLMDPRSLVVGDRVRVELTMRRAVIHGKSSGSAPRTVTDLNTATEPGDYLVALGGSNMPVNQPLMVRTQRFDMPGVYDGRIIQTARTVGLPLSNRLSRGLYSRMFDGTTWSPWAQTIALTGTIVFNGSGGAVRASQAISFPTDYFVGDPNVVVGNATNAGGAVIFGEGASATRTGFTAYGVASTGAAFSGTYVLKWVAQEVI